jgi:hypothetical protein
LEIVSRVKKTKYLSALNPVFHRKDYTGDLSPPRLAHQDPDLQMDIFFINNGPIPWHKEPWEKDQSNGDHPGMHNTVH